MPFYLFLAFEGVIYISFLCMDLFGVAVNVANALKFAGVVLCFVFSVLAAWIIRNSDNPYSGNAVIEEMAVQTSSVRRKNVANLYKHIAPFAALFFTCIADVFLIFTSHFIIGLIFFCTVQVLYAFVLERKLALILPVIAGISSLVSLIVQFAGVGTTNSVLVMLTVFYGLLFGSNFVSAFLVGKQNGKRYLFAVGLLLFMLCDVNVLIRNLYDFNVIAAGTGAVRSIAMKLTWFFYLPSQVILSVCAGFGLIPKRRIQKKDS